MSPAKIFLVGENESQLGEMVETPYDKEDLLQLLLERYPDLMPGDQIDPDNPRRWLLISREMGVPGKEQGGNIWSLDHLFLDQDGIPTFVECKRASDTRLRREVVAQMLDYAANGIVYWSIDALRHSAQEIAKKKGHNLEEDLRQLVTTDEPIDVDVFWKKVEQNLRKGRVRLIFVSDRTPPELRRLVEFLNEKMNDVEVLAVEVKQFLGKGSHKAIVPRVVGWTEKPITGPTQKKLTRETFLEQCDTEEYRAFFGYLIDRALGPGYTIGWGTSAFSVRCARPDGQGWISFLYCYSSGRVDLFLDYLKLSEEEEKDFRKEMMAFGIFKPAGKSTLRLGLTPANAAQLCLKVDSIFEKAKGVVAKNIS